MEQLEQLQKWEEKVAAYRFALTMIGLDANQNPPIQGAQYRNEKRAFLSGELLKIQKDPEIEQLLDQLATLPLEEEDARKVELYRNQFKKTKDIPVDEYVEYQKILSLSEQQWLICKKEDDYESYAPYLKDVITGYEKMVSYQDSPLGLYDRMLEDHQDGWNEEKYDAFFQAVKERLVPLIQQISKQEPIDRSFLTKYYPREKQMLFTEHLCKYLGFDETWGKVGESEHPLTTTVCKGDIRFTTKYREHDLGMAVLSTIHESGHAYYGHGVDSKYDGTIFATSINAGIHESQSRFCENHLGRSLSFWKANYPALQDIFSEELANVSVEEFYRGLNESHPSLIRTDADELTYPLHIMIRYELEKGMFHHTIDINQLDQLWNEKYQEYLGITVPNARDGILQDMHWPYAYFGYFPTYALGSAFAAQFYHACRQELRVEELLENNQYQTIMKWLETNVHSYGNRYNPDTVLEKATKEPFNVNYYLDYLEEKYRRLYNL